LNPQVVANKIRELSDVTDSKAEDTLEQARAATAGQKLFSKPFLSSTFGYIGQWFSEVAGGDDLLRTAAPRG
jgi:hypothetical protein